MLLYCTQLDLASIGTYAHRRRQYKRKVAQWGVENLHSMNKLEDIFVLPYNECNH